MAKYLKPQTPLQHYSGDYIYPITSVDQVLTSNGERLNANLISIDLKNSVDSDKVVLGTQITPVSIEGGGTNATNAADARRNLEITPENIGAMKMELLWENASPDSDFGLQSVKGDFSQYTHVMIFARRNTTNDANMTAVLLKVGDAGHIQGNIDGFIHERAVVVLPEEVFFYNHSFYRTYGGTSESNNAYLIPTAIYGIKGVSA